MNKDTAKIIIEDLLTDVSDVLRNHYTQTTLVWWRGRISGVVDTVRAVVDDIDLQKCDTAIEALLEAEGNINC